MSDNLALLKDPDFLMLSRKKDAVTVWLTVVTMLVYYGFIVLLAFQKDFLKIKVGDVPLGIPIGIGVIVLSAVFTGIYVYWANTTYDTLVEKVKAKVT